MTTLEQRITETLAAHVVITAQRIDTKQPVAQCKCGAEINGGGAKWKEHQADRVAAALAPVIAEAQAEALEVFGRELFDRSKRSRTAPNMTSYQRGRADCYESAQVLAERRAKELEPK